MPAAQLQKYISFYLGCDTNKGRFVGIEKNVLRIETVSLQTENYDIQSVGSSLFLYLRRLNDLSDEQRKQLIQEGVVIGRPHGYTFSNSGFVYLLSLYVDLFGLINAGYAKDLGLIEKESH